MPSRDVFALDRSGLNGFLYAPIGTELDGSHLTVLSALARLGEDPWAKAASWARMSRAAASAALAAIIAQMPVTQDDQLAAAKTAARLVQLLSPAAMPGTQQAKPSDVQPRLKLVVALAMFACTVILLGGGLLIYRQDMAEQLRQIRPAASHNP